MRFFSDKKQGQLTFYLTPIPIRNILPFSAYMILFSGFSELLNHYHWLGIVWSVFVLISIVVWLFINMKNDVLDFFDQLALVQFFIIVAHLVFVFVKDQAFLYSLYFFLLVLLVMPFSRLIIQLASLQLTALIFFQFNFLPTGFSQTHFTDSLAMSVVLGVCGFLLSYLKSDDPLPVRDVEEPGNTVDPMSFQRPLSTSPTSASISSDREQIKLESEEETRERIRQILTMVSDILTPHTTLYFELKRDSGILKPMTVIGNTDQIRMDIAIDIGHGPIGWAAKNAMPFTWNRSIGESDPDYYRQKIGIQSLLAIPITDGSLLSGVLVLDSKKSDAFSIKDQKVMDVFARQIALMLEIQNLAYSEQLEVIKFKNLNKFGNRLIKSLILKDLLDEIALQMNEIIEFQAGFILIFNTETEKLEVVEDFNADYISMKGQSFDEKEGLVGWVFQNQPEPVIFSEARKLLANRPLFGYGDPDLDVKSLLFLPINSPSRPLGLVLLLSNQDDSFLRVSGEFLKILANQYSLALINARMYQQLEQLAVTDGLTKLINHRYFQEILTNEFNRLKRDLKPLTLIMIDIDHFKKFNDQYGHPVGDQVLKRVARILTDSCRETDYVARYGGEEFVALLINTDKEGAMLMGERIRQTIAQDTLMIEQKALKVTVSLGTATIPDDCNEKQKLIDLADQALYQAKETGRNRVVQFESADE